MTRGLCKHCNSAAVSGGRGFCHANSSGCDTKSKPITVSPCIWCCGFSKYCIWYSFWGLILVIAQIIHKVNSNHLMPLSNDMQVYSTAKAATKLPVMICDTVGNKYIKYPYGKFFPLISSTFLEICRHLLPTNSTTLEKSSPNSRLRSPV